MTKKEIRERLMDGETLGSILEFRCGQECMMFKVDHDEFESAGDDDVVYVPDIDLNEIHVDKDLSVDIEGIFHVLGECYTKGDFIEEAGGNEEAAAYLFGYVDWQHLSSAWTEIAEDWEGEEGD